MSLLASPRRRRRLAWAAGAAACVGLIAAVVVVVPSRSRPANRTRPTAPQFGATTNGPPAFTTTLSAADERARERAETAVRPLSAVFVNAMIHRTNFERAHALLTASFQTGSVGDWQLGQHVPLTFDKGSSVGSVTIAYSGPTEVGVVVSVEQARRPRWQPGRAQVRQARW